MKADYKKLYRISEDNSLRGGSMRVEPEDIGIDRWALLRGDVRARKGIPFVHQKGKRVCDVIWTGFVACVLISKRFRDVCKREGFTGWSTYPVKVYDAEGKQLRGYSGLAITGRAGAIDEKRAKKVWRGPAVDGGPRWQNYLGMYFDNDEWDGSDFCLPGDTGFKIITERMKEALETELFIPNVEFQRLTEVERGVS